MAHHVIYIPGLGDHYSYGQDIALVYWRAFGLHTHYLALGWRNKEGFDTKINRIVEKIDRLTAQGHKVSLCGTSAGASAALAAYTLRPEVRGVVTIAGKVQRPESIWQTVRNRNPDFYEGARRLPQNIDVITQRGDLKNILCIYTNQDKTVPPKDAFIPGAHTHVVSGWNHKSGIFFGVLAGAPTIGHFLGKR